MTGNVKWFDNAKGFGFITASGGGGDIFAHYQSIVGADKFKVLQDGEAVTFDVVNTPKGVRAVNIKRKINSSQ